MTPGELRQSRLKLLAPELEGVKGRLDMLAYRLANWGPRTDAPASTEILAAARQVGAEAKRLYWLAGEIEQVAE